MTGIKRMSVVFAIMAFIVMVTASAYGSADITHSRFVTNGPAGNSIAMPISSNYLGDVTRSANIPLNAFDIAGIALTASTAVTRTNVHGLAAISFGGASSAVVNSITTTFIVPPDFVEAPGLRLVTSEGINTGGAFGAASVSNQLDFTVKSSGTGEEPAAILAGTAISVATSAASTMSTATKTFTTDMPFPASLYTGLAAGDVVTVRVWKSAGTGNARIHAAEFRYSSKQ